MNKSKRVIISFSSNDWYAEHLCVAIYSLLKNLSKNHFANIYILDWGISSENKKNIKSIVKKVWNGEIDFILMDRSKYEGWNVKNLSQETYYRLDLPELLPNVDKILYLDVDLIISWDISSLFRIEINDKIAGAVREITTINYYPDDHNIQSPYRLFFNAGVLLLNLKKMRSDNTKEKILNCMQKHNFQLKTHDQEALNIVLLNERESIHPKYNALPFLRATKHWKHLWYTDEEFIEAKNNPIIIHFAGEKPWKQNCFHPLAYLYHNYREEVWLEPINFSEKIKFKDYLKQKISQITLFLQANLPNKIYRYLIYKPYRFLFRIK